MKENSEYEEKEINLREASQIKKKKLRTSHEVSFEGSYEQVMDKLWTSYKHVMNKL